MQNFLGRLQSSSFLLKFSSVQFLNLEPTFGKIQSHGKLGNSLEKTLVIVALLPPSLLSFLLSLCPPLPPFRLSFFSLSAMGTHFNLSLLMGLLEPVFLGSQGLRVAALERQYREGKGFSGSKGTQFVIVYSAT